MVRGSVVRTSFPLLVTLASLTACAVEKATTPDTRSPAAAKAVENDLPRVVPYAGTMTAGTHVVCTSKFSIKPGHYSISVENAGDGDVWAREATIPPGTCAVVFETGGTGFGLQVSITPTPVSLLSKVWTYTPACDPHCVPVCETPVQFFGFSASVTKFYFTKPDPVRNPHPHGLHDPTECIDYGGHGGGGTLDFALD